MNEQTEIQIESSLLTGELSLGRINITKPSPKIGKVKQYLDYLGPAFVISVAYIDPGNFATNISGGSIFNYNLIWVNPLEQLNGNFFAVLVCEIRDSDGTQFA